jgi:lipopolysaccharide export system permease protein
MKTVRKLIHGQIYQSVAFVAVGFLALFFFFDLVEELQNLNQRSEQGFRLMHALLAVLSKTPAHLYELLPIAVLIGCIYVMARLAQSSEFTVLRTGGLGPGKALKLMMHTGWVFVALTYFLGDHVAPWAQQQELALRSIYRSSWSSGQSGAWMREKTETEQMAINVRAIGVQDRLQDIRIHRFDLQGQLLGIVQATSGEWEGDGWVLHDVQRMQTQPPGQTSSLRWEQLPLLAWPTQLTKDMVAAALINADNMSTRELFTYARHLRANNQNAQSYELLFWRKVFYPLSCLVMLALALPFAYLHFRSGQIATHVFGGVLAGISFYLLNNVFSFLGGIHQWEPWITSAAPALIYTAVSLATFWWMVLRR